MSVELDPELDDELLKKYESDSKWRRVYNDVDKVVFESTPLRYESESCYLPGTLN